MNETELIRVMVVDDHDMVRSGLEALLETCDDLVLVGEAADGYEAIRQCENLQPDVILMDLVMPRLDGVAATQSIRERHPQVQIIALTNYMDKKLVQDALEAGAISYLLKNVSIDELSEAIRAANAGKPTLAPEATQILIKAATQPPTPGHDITNREMEVLALMVEGLNNREIAEKLTISVSTVKNHVSSVLGKLGVSNRVEAVALAVEHNLIR